MLQKRKKDAGLKGFCVNSYEFDMKPEGFVCNESPHCVCCTLLGLFDNASRMLDAPARTCMIVITILHLCFHFPADVGKKVAHYYFYLTLCGHGK